MVSEMVVRSGKLYPIREFARLSGVTVRALHPYDRLNLLRPRCTDSRYRLYSLGDLERLEQIIALKFLGVPLKQVGGLLDREAADLPLALRRQRKALEAKRRLLGRAIRAIREAEAHPEPGILKKIIEVIEMQINTDWMKKYYTEKAWKKIRQRPWSPELQERVSREWSELFRDVEAALGEDPACEKAQALLVRWDNLVRQFTGGDPEVTTGLQNLYADRSNWTSDLQQQMTPFRNKRVWRYISQARTCRR